MRVVDAMWAISKLKEGADFNKLYIRKQDASSVVISTRWHDSMKFSDQIFEIDTWCFCIQLNLYTFITT